MLLLRALGVSIASLLLFSLFTYSNVYSEEEYVDVLIGFTEDADESEIVEEVAEVKYDFTSIDAIAASVPVDAIDELAADPNVAYVEPDGRVYALGHTSSLLEYQNAWGVDHIEADQVHSIGNTGIAVRICIPDTGIDYNHPDLAANYKGGKDFINNDNDPKDDHGHGTHVAGIAAAVLDGVGVVGVAPQVHLYSAKVLNAVGFGQISDVIAGIEWCVDQHVQIISMSLGDNGGSTAWKDALKAAYSDGVLLIAAAGNSGNCAGTGSNVKFPARYPSVIAVAMTHPNDARHCQSSTGAQIEISAPGVSINSTKLNGGYRLMSGTSMATPHVAGAAALIWRSDETLWVSQGYTNGDGVWSNGEVRTVLDRTAQDLGVPGRDRHYGYGLVRPDMTLPANAANIEATSFDSFSANVKVIMGCDTSENRLKARGTFTFEEGTKIKVQREHVTLIIGPFEFTIPGGLFKKKIDTDEKKNILFASEIENLKGKMWIRDLGGKTFTFTVVARSFDLSWLDGEPVLVKLNVNHVGQALVTPDIIDTCT